MTSEAEEFVVLEDRERRYYVIPRRTLDDAPVADSSAARVRELLAGEVSGYSFFASPYDSFASRGIIIVGGHQGLAASRVRFLRR
jgi:hypothetical protein